MKFADFEKVTLHGLVPIFVIVKFMNFLEDMGIRDTTQPHEIPARNDQIEFIKDPTLKVYTKYEVFTGVTDCFKTETLTLREIRIVVDECRFRYLVGVSLDKSLAFHCEADWNLDVLTTRKMINMGHLRKIVF